MTQVIVILCVFVALLFAEACVARWRDQKLDERIREQEQKP